MDSTKDSLSKIKNNAFKRPPISRQALMTRFNNSFFYGYCLSYNYFGRKAVNCRVFERNDFRFMSRNSFAPPRNYKIICYKCNNVGHSKACKSGMANFSKQN